MEDVHFDRFHAVEITFEDVERDEVAANINHQAAPCEAWMILNRDCGSSEAVGRYFDKLKEGLQSAQHAKRICGVQFCSRSGDLESIGFVFAQFLDFFAGVIGMDD